MMYRPNFAPTDLPPAVVLGLSATGLHAIRALGRAGVTVYASGSAPHAGAASAFVAGSHIDPDPRARIDWLTRAFRGRPVVLIPTSDQDVDLILDNLDRFGPEVRLPGAYLSGLARRIMDKDRFYRLCAAHGLDYPEVTEGYCDSLAAHADSLTYPAFVKPARIQDCKALLKGQKGWIVRGPDALRRRLASLPARIGKLLVQRIIEGPESEIALYCGYFDADGKPRQGFTARKLRQYPPGFGSASLVQSTDEPEARALAEGFLSRLGYHGIAAAEFKRDPTTGRLAMIEINVRPSLWFGLAEAAARPTVLAAYYDLAGTEITLADLPQRQGVRWHYGGKDAWSAAFYARRSDFVLPAPDLGAVGPAQEHVRAVYEPGDWRPAMAEAVALARKATQRLPRRSHAR